ncbi:MAG: peptidase C14, caspase catalytic subunit p20, partial [Gammaproteobacteria bacterium]|nr:peptidase C14, caspase catalytic subunit p20 [Gammaproteobacteria bacterium]
PWLGKPLAAVNITDQTLQRQIVAVMINRFNQTLQKISKDFPGTVYHVDCRKLIGSISNWHDELHPKNSGFFKVAERFDAVITQALD